MNEYTFQGHIKSGFAPDNKIYLHKISDTAIGQKKPFDFIGSLQGRSFAIEAKLTKYDRVTGLPEDRVFRHQDAREHQVKELKKFAETEGLGLVALGLYSTTAPRYKRAWLMPVSVFVSIPADQWWTVEMLDNEVEVGKVISLCWKSGENSGWYLDQKARDYLAAGGLW